ncbi:RING finger domain protein [Hokovirus HKV1]|uniref:RING finger domain protein n=1 Tax=Hokovirus HKV1 TaxID=1977638 RepID=A0A1V0SH50_9VIRU|nr:RING finger domain protein [Hokovirus HKV1]
MITEATKYNIILLATIFNVYFYNKYCLKPLEYLLKKNETKIRKIFLICNNSINFITDESQFLNMPNIKKTCLLQNIKENIMHRNKILLFDNNFTIKNFEYKKVSKHVQFNNQNNYYYKITIVNNINEKYILKLFLNCGFRMNSYFFSNNLLYSHGINHDLVSSICHKNRYTDLYNICDISHPYDVYVDYSIFDNNNNLKIYIVSKNSEENIDDFIFTLTNRIRVEILENKSTVNVKIYNEITFEKNFYNYSLIVLPVNINRVFGAFKINAYSIGKYDHNIKATELLNYYNNGSKTYMDLQNINKINYKRKEYLQLLYLQLADLINFKMPKYESEFDKDDKCVICLDKLCQTNSSLNKYFSYCGKHPFHILCMINYETANINKTDYSVCPLCRQLPKIIYPNVVNYHDFNNFSSLTIIDDDNNFN